jgi:hypothetical protein
LVQAPFERRFVNEKALFQFRLAGILDGELIGGDSSCPVLVIAPSVE